MLSLYFAHEIWNREGRRHVEARQDSWDHHCSLQGEGQSHLCDFNVQELQEHQDSALSPRARWGDHTPFMRPRLSGII